MKVRPNIIKTTSKPGDWRFDERLITKEEAAVLQNISRRTVDNWQKSSKTKFSIVYLSQNAVRLKLSEVIDALPITEEEKQHRREISLKRVPEILTLAHAADILAISPPLLSQIENGRKNGVEPIPYFMQGQHKRIRKRDLYEYIDRHTVK